MSRSLKPFIYAEFQSWYIHCLPTNFSVMVVLIPKWCSGKERIRLPMQETQDTGSTHKFRRSPGIGNGTPLQYSFLVAQLLSYH